jgi:hypothetical protein
LSGSVFLSRPPLAWPAPLEQAPERTDEQFWLSVRQQFLMPPDLGVLNAANLCPSPAPVLEAMYRSTKDMDGDPSFDNRLKMSAGKEETRRLVAGFLRVTPEEIVLTRNTSEGNNMVSSGLDLKAGDEVVVFADNHPSNNAAWTQKSKRFGSASPLRIRVRSITSTPSGRPSRPGRACSRSRTIRARWVMSCRPGSCARSRASAAS